MVAWISSCSLNDIFFFLSDEGKCGDNDGRLAIGILTTIGGGAVDDGGSGGVISDDVAVEMEREERLQRFFL